jgi:tetratricopeptide (TPR) repeat protein
MAQDKSDEARKRVVQQIEHVPQSPFLHNLLGQLWAKDKDYVQAEQEFKKAIELDNSLLPAYLNLATTYFKMGKQDQAMKEYEAVLIKNANALQAHMMLGMIHEKRNEFDKAQARYETILKINPRFAPAANNLAWRMVQQGGNLDVALSYAQTAREGDPNDPHIADTLGWIYYKKNAFLLAINLLKEAVDKLPNIADVHYHYGMALAKNNNAAEAKKALQTAFKLNANFDGAEDARNTLKGL